jgi:hypothetical protein
MSDSARTDIKFDITFAEFLRLQRFVAQSGARLSLKRLTPLLAAITIVVAGVLLIKLAKVETPQFAVLFSCLVTVVLAISAYLTLTARGRMRSIFDQVQRSIVSFDDESFTVSFGGVTFSSRWSSLEAVYELRNALYLVFGSVVGSVVPNRAFESDLARIAFRDLVAKHAAIVKV